MPGQCEQESFQRLLLHADTITAIKLADLKDPDKSDNIQKLLSVFSGDPYFTRGNTQPLTLAPGDKESLEWFLKCIGTLLGLKPFQDEAQKENVATIKAAFNHLRGVHRKFKSETKTNANARDLRNLSRGLGITGNIEKYSLEKIVACYESNKPLYLGDNDKFPVKIVLRQRQRTTPVPNGKLMTEAGKNDSLEEQFFALPLENYYVVQPDESVIFISKDAGGTYHLELVVLRNMIRHPELRDDILRWLRKVADDAVDERRDLRPNHEGKMVQTAVGPGPRHARLFGGAVSYVVHLSPEIILQHDLDGLGAGSLLWTISDVLNPADIMDHIENEIANAKLPRAFTRSVEEGDGFECQIRGKKYEFTLRRCPPEIFITRGYIAEAHVDPSYCDWVITFCIDRCVKEVEYRQSQRSSVRERRPPAFIPGGGANFVDCHLQVLVKQEKNTLMSFKPQFRHGTTVACGAVNHSLTFAFSQKLLDAYNTAQQQLGGRDVLIVSGEGAGQGNPWRAEKDEIIPVNKSV